MDKKSRKFSKILKNWLFLWTPLFLIATVPHMSTWVRDSHLITLQDFILPLIFSLIISILVALIFYYPFSKKNRSAFFAGAVLSVYLMGEHEILLGFMESWKTNMGAFYFFFAFILIITFAYGISLLIYILLKNKKFDTNLFANSIAIAVTITFLIQFVPMVKIVIIEWPQFFYRPAELSLNQNLSAKSRPDIYYLIFDRYANQNVLKEQLDFDNSGFTDYLQGEGFYVKPDAYSNYPFTSMSIASTLLADYNIDLVDKFKNASYQTIEPYHLTIRYSPVIKALKKLGYNYHLVSNWFEATSVSLLANNYEYEYSQLIFLNKKYTLTTWERKIMENSIFYSLFTHPIKIGNFTLTGDINKNQVHSLLAQIDQLEKIASTSTGNNFVLAHVMVPHPPYRFNPDGTLSDNPWQDNVGINIKEKYTNQILFLNERIKKLVDLIIKNSNDQAIIIIQPDEGPYPIELMAEDPSQIDSVVLLRDKDMGEWSDNYLKMKYGIMAAYHIPQATEEELYKGADSVNIFRLVFNAYFNQNMEYLPSCYYAYPKGRDYSFDYVNINERLTGQNNSKCPVDGS